MKIAIKFILSFLCYLLFIPAVLLSSIGITWYILPTIQTTNFGNFILTFVDKQEIFLITISMLFFSVIFGILGKIFTVVKNSKALNFYTHLITWLLAIFLVIEAIYSFIASGDIHTASINLTMVRKIGIIACVQGLLLYSIISPKVRVLVNRRIQAYDTAKELNANGRSSVVGIQILKCFDFICPEIFLLAALCFACDWKISLYFIFIICAFIVPILGNMICDKRVKIEAKRRQEEQVEAQVNATAEAVVDLLKQTGSAS